MTTGSGQRWMLKYYVGFFGGADPNEMIPEAVLKTLIYKEVGSPCESDSAVFALDSLKTVRRGLARQDGSPDRPRITNRTAIPDAEAVELGIIQRGGSVTIGSGGASLWEREHVVQFTGNGMTAEVDLRTEEAIDPPQRDLRFKAILRSAAVEPDDTASMAALRSWIGESGGDAADLLPAVTTCDDQGRSVSFDPETIYGQYGLQAFFYIEQPEGFLGVAELIKKDQPTIRRLLISLHIQGTDGREQRYIVTPPYDVTNLGELYTVGFHQETHGDQSWLEFIIGRDDNYAPFATYNLAREDEFFFRRSAGSGKTEVGIGCWPELSDEKPALHFTGYIKEIICDPWGECTRC